MAEVCVFDRGRARDRALNASARRAAGYQFAANVAWRRRYIETKRNVADAGSRLADAGRIRAGNAVYGSAVSRLLRRPLVRAVSETIAGGVVGLGRGHSTGRALLQYSCSRFRSITAWRRRLHLFVTHSPPSLCWVALGRPPGRKQVIAGIADSRRGLPGPAERAVRPLPNQCSGQFREPTIATDVFQYQMQSLARAQVGKSVMRMIV